MLTTPAGYMRCPTLCTPQILAFWMTLPFATFGLFSGLTESYISRHPMGLALFIWSFAATYCLIMHATIVRTLFL